MSLESVFRIGRKKVDILNSDKSIMIIFIVPCPWLSSVAQASPDLIFFLSFLSVGIIGEAVCLAFSLSLVLGSVSCHFFLDQMCADTSLTQLSVCDQVGPSWGHLSYQCFTRSSWWSTNCSLLVLNWWAFQMMCAVSGPSRPLSLWRPYKPRKDGGLAVGRTRCVQSIRLSGSARVSAFAGWATSRIFFGRWGVRISC